MKAACWLAGSLALCAAWGAVAQTVSRCEGEDGHLTFTTLQCPPGSEHSLHRAYHPFITSESERTATREREERRRLDREMRRMSEE